MLERRLHAGQPKERTHSVHADNAVVGGLGEQGVEGDTILIMVGDATDDGARRSVEEADDVIKEDVVILGADPLMRLEQVFDPIVQLEKMFAGTTLTPRFHGFELEVAQLVYSSSVGSGSVMDSDGGSSSSSSSSSIVRDGNGDTVTTERVVSIDKDGHRHESFTKSVRHADGSSGMHLRLPIIGLWTVSM